MKRVPVAKSLLLSAWLSLGMTVASAGELAELHRQLVGGATASEATAEPPARPEEPSGGGAEGVPGVRPLMPLPPREPPPDIERIGYEAVRCRGFCEAFTVIFAADGTFSYVGEAYVDRLGEHTGTVDRSALGNVMRFVAEIDYRDLENTYQSQFADVQTTYTMVDYGEDVKVIQDQGGSAPATVWALGRLLRDLLEDASWD